MTERELYARQREEREAWNGSRERPDRLRGLVWRVVAILFLIRATMGGLLYWPLRIWWLLFVVSVCAMGAIAWLAIAVGVVTLVF